MSELEIGDRVRQVIVREGIYDGTGWDQIWVKFDGSDYALAVDPSTLEPVVSE